MKQTLAWVIVNLTVDALFTSLMLLGLAEEQ